MYPICSSCAWYWYIMLNGYIKVIIAQYRNCKDVFVAFDTDYGKAKQSQKKE